MVDFLRKKTPSAFYAGAVYSEPPTHQQPIHRLNWMRRELVFDIDLDMYDSVRTCGCKGATKLCEICWEHVKTAAVFINGTLVEDFGVKGTNIQWVFSGRRGVHAWVKNKQFSYFNQDVRSALIDYMSLVKGDKIFKIPAKGTMPLFRKRVFDHVVKNYIGFAIRNDLIGIGLTEAKARRIAADRETTGVTDLMLKNQILTRMNKLEKNEKITENILRNHYPRIDHKVSIDLRRLLRAPGSIHGDTGNKVTFLTLKELEKFNPLQDAESIN